MNEIAAFLERSGVDLEQSGVKGMHWGVRKELSSLRPSNIKKGRAQATPAQRKAGRRKFERNLAIGVAGGAAVGLGAAYVVKSHIMRRKYKEIVKAVDSGTAWVSGKDLNYVINPRSGGRLTIGAGGNRTKMSPENIRRLTSNGGKLVLGGKPKAMSDAIWKKITGV